MHIIARGMRGMRRRDTLLSLSWVQNNVYAASLPAGSCGSWCRFVVRYPPRVVPVAVSLRILGADQSTVSASFLDSPRFRHRRAYRTAILFVPPEAHSVHIAHFGVPFDTAPDVVGCTRLSRGAAAVSIGLRHPYSLVNTAVRAVLAGQYNPLRRLRTEIATLQRPCGSERPYSLWIESFDNWTDAKIASLLHSARGVKSPDIAVFVCSTVEGRVEPLTATRIAVETGPFKASCSIIGPSGQSLAAALQATTAEYIALLQAGELLPAHALPLLANQAMALGRPSILYADEDQLTASGSRIAPLFKPEPSRTLMLSGTLTRGVWLIRHQLLVGEEFAKLAPWAEALRLAVWLRLWEAGQATASHRIPYVLTHRRPDTQLAPASALAAVVEAHVARTDLPARIEANTPLTVQIRALPAQQTKVTIVVPSTCRSLRSISCLSRVLQRTDYVSFELLIVISDCGPLDTQQQNLLARLQTDRRVRYTVMKSEQFNYAEANNYAVRQTNATFVCLLNDDVVPMNPNWLAGMVGHMVDPYVGIVGARLYYPDARLQHGGIIMLPSGTSTHLDRFLPLGAPGYGARALLSQEVSAVTGACMLVRRHVYEALGGFDQAYAIAHSDVDFCLRAREAGWGVVLSGDAQLWHHESASRGSCYSLRETTRLHEDQQRMRRRWVGVCHDDPFYNPNLSEVPGDIWNLAFPPRTRVRNEY